MINTVTFPGLGLEFELNRIAFSVFGHNVYWYGVIIACGFLLAVWYGMWRAPKYGIDPDHIIDLLLFAVPLCLIGARAYYVIFNPSICFDENGRFSFYNMIAVWDGGLAIYGGVIMAFLVGLIYCRIRKENFWDYADVGSLGIMIGQLVGRWGNFINVEAFGGLTTLPWRMCSERIANVLWSQGQITDMDTYRAVIDGTLGVHPTFLYESLWNLLGFIILALLARKRKFKGQNFAGYLIWYGFGRALIEGLRTDSLYFFGTGIRTSQMVGVLSVILGVVVLVVRSRTGKIVPEAEVETVEEHTEEKIETIEERTEEGTSMAAATIIDGKALAAKVKEQVRAEAASLERKPGLAVIIVGDDPASRVYVNSKRKDCEECGFVSEEFALPAGTEQEELLALVDTLNHRDDIDGILVQLPLPKGLDERAVLLAIDPAKDVDCFHPYNVGQLTIGEPVFQPCTPGGVMEMLKEYHIDPAGKKCVVLGRSNIVGKPMALLLLHAHGTVTVCHSRTPDLAAECRQADILVSAIGKTGIVTADMVKEGAVVIDVAMNRNDAGKLCGDVCYDEVAAKAGYITPVPGGVGPMTRAMLMRNTLTAAQNHQK